MRWPVAGCIFLGLLSAGLAQQTYPPINRDIEMLEKSARSVDGSRQSELQAAYDEARKAAAEMVQTAGELRNLHASGDQVPAVGKPYQDEAKKLCRKIRDLVKPIEKVSFLDPGESGDVDSFDQVRSREAVALLADEMVSLSQSIRVRLDSLAGRGVGVRELKTRSLDTLLESAKRLSKTIEKSSSKL